MNIFIRHLIFLFVLNFYGISYATFIEEEVKSEDFIPASKNSKPTSKLMFSLDLSKNYLWHDEKYSQQDKAVRVTDVCEKVRDLFKKFDMEPLPDMRFFEDHKKNKADFIFGKMMAGNEVDALGFVSVYYCGDQKEDLFEDIKLFTYLTPKGAGHWDFPEKREDNKKQWVVVTENSWEWVDITIHNICDSFMKGKMYEEPYPHYVISDKMYERFRLYGLEKSIARIAIVADDNKQYRFYSIFNSEEERKMSEEFIFKVTGV